MTFRRRWETLLWNLGIASRKKVEEDIETLLKTITDEAVKSEELRQVLLSVAATTMSANPKYTSVVNRLTNDFIFGEEMNENVPIFPYGND